MHLGLHEKRRLHSASNFGGHHHRVKATVFALTLEITPPSTTYTTF